MARKNLIALAWQRYLEETRDLVGPHYTEVEDWAWNRLMDALGDAEKSVARSKAKVANAS